VSATAAEAVIETRAVFSGYKSEREDGVGIQARENTKETNSETDELTRIYTLFLAAATAVAAGR